MDNQKTQLVVSWSTDYSADVKLRNDEELVFNIYVDINTPIEGVVEQLNIQAKKQGYSLWDELVCQVELSYRKKKIVHDQRVRKEEEAKVGAYYIVDKFGNSILTEVNFNHPTRGKLKRKFNFSNIGPLNYEATGVGINRFAEKREAERYVYTEKDYLYKDDEAHLWEEAKK